MLIEIDSLLIQHFDESYVQSELVASLRHRAISDYSFIHKNEPKAS